MRLLSRKEEVILLSVWRLQENAYGVPICREVERATGRRWLNGAIYACLARLLKDGLLESLRGEPAPERGGRRKIYYRLTRDGKETLLAVQRMNALTWSGLPTLKVKDA
jgi:DNA-binding PadR family transcriptional regulator